MPLTPTEQNRQRERDNNHSMNGVGGSSPTKSAKKNESRQGSSGPGGVGASQGAPTGANGQFFQQSKRGSGRDNSLNNQDASA